MEASSDVNHTTRITFYLEFLSKFKYRSGRQDKHFNKKNFSSEIARGATKRFTTREAAIYACR